jgi:Integrase core domain
MPSWPTTIGSSVRASEWLVSCEQRAWPAVTAGSDFGPQCETFANPWHRTWSPEGSAPKPQIVCGSPDITYVPTWSGSLYLATVLDVFSRRIVGWSMADHLRADLVIDALDMAAFDRNANGVTHHSDQGCQDGFNRSKQHRLVGATVGVR